METERQKTFLIHFAYFAVLLLLVFALVRYALPLVAPFAAALVVAYLLKRPIALLREKLGITPKLAAILAVALFYGAVGALLALLSVKAVSGLVGHFYSGTQQQFRIFQFHRNNPGKNLRYPGILR